MTAELETGATIGGYRIEGRVGRGGMGVVYRAADPRLGRMVALKVLAPELASDTAFRERFERESRLAAQIDHPNVVPVYGAGEADGLLYIAMRWVEGDDLGEVVRREGPLALERTVRLLGQVAAALDAAHARGLIHRDVKPANVLVTPGLTPHEPEHAYLTDFGIAKATTSPGLTRTGFFLGTPDYAAPEQFEGRELDRRVDVYALACMLYHCLAGKRPFERTDDVAVMYAHVAEPPPRLGPLRDDVPAALDDVIARGMAKARDDRFASAGELAAAMRAALDAPAPVRPAAPQAAAPAETQPLPRPGETAAVPPPRPAASAPPAARPRRPAPRRGILAAVAALLVLAGAAVAAVLALGGGGEQEARAPAPPPPPPAPSAPATTGGGGTAATPGTWARVTAEGLGGPGRQAISRVAAIDDAVVAVGTQGETGSRDVAIWLLRGLGGDVTVTSRRVEEPGDQIPFGLGSTGDGGVVVVGTTRSGAVPDGDAAVLVFDGFTLEARPVAAPGFEKMNRVLSTGSALVAVGAAGPGTGPTGVPQATDAAVWRSRDGGATWERVDVDTFRRPGYQEMRGLARFAGGTAGVGHDRADGAVWLSDGIEWRRVAAGSPALAAGEGEAVELRDVQELDGGLVAVGDVRRADGQRDPAVWVSADGASWAAVESPAFAGPADEQAIGVATGPFGAVAVGCERCETPQARPRVWTSPDGRSWSRVPEGRLPAGGGGEQLTGVTVAGGLLVAGGRRGDDAVVWTTPVPAR